MFEPSLKRIRWLLRNKICKSLTIPLKNNLILLTHSHNFHQLSDCLQIRYTALQTHSPINSHIAQPIICSSLVELVAYLPVHSEAEVIDEMFYHCFLGLDYIFGVLYLLEPPVFLNLELDLPQIKVLLMSHPPFPYQLPQLLKRFLSQLVLTLPPT